MRIAKPFGVVMCVVCVLAVVAVAQTNSSQPAMQGEHQMGQMGQHQMGGQKQPLSPRGQAQFAFEDGKKVEVDYGRPYIRNRKIMGGLVPYGKVWRTGANAATSFVTQAPLKIGNLDVPAGSYTLYTIPNENEWTLIANKQTGQWGTQYNESQDLGRVTMKLTKLSSPVDQFTISFEKQGPKKSLMKLEWENTSAAVPITEETK